MQSGSTAWEHRVQSGPDITWVSDQPPTNVTGTMYVRVRVGDLMSWYVANNKISAPLPSI